MNVRYWLLCSWRSSHKTTTRHGVTRCLRCRRTWGTLPRHLDPAICHALTCRWTPRHPEFCDCEQGAGA